MTNAHSFFEDMAWDSLCCYKEENLVKLESQLNGKLKETENSWAGENFVFHHGLCNLYG